MRSVEPKDLPAHRAFFTEFDLHGDPTKWATPSERETVALSMERKLKLLLLTKANVLVAASQLLESPFAHSILLKNPQLLESGAIVSSIKLGHKSSYEFLEIKRQEEKERANSPYHSSQATDIAHLIDDKGLSVRWPLSLMSDWFRDRLVKDLTDEKSLIRVALSNEGVLFPYKLANAIAMEEGLSRGRVDQLAREFGDKKLRDFINIYADFVYYLSGARATESEGVLPQENLIEISVSDLVGAKTHLSENEIFFKVFIDTVKARTSTIFPSDFLDAISIKDALDLRSVAISKEFVSQYNSLQQKTKEAIEIEDPERLVLLLGELEEFETGLFQRFNSALDIELGSRLSEFRQRAAGRVLHSLASIAIPGYGIDSYKDLIVSGLQWTGKKQAAKKIEHKIGIGLDACGSALERMGLLERQALLDFVDTLRKKYSEKFYM